MFVAIEVPEAVRQAVWALSNRLHKSGVRASWVKPEAMHLTLRFLGEVSAEDAERLGQFLAESYQDNSSFTLFVRGTGAFPNIRHPSVVWAGLEPLEGALAHVQQVAEDAAQRLGLAPERKRFHPHLTLARIRDAREAQALTPYLAREKDFELEAFAATGVTLFLSQLTPSGPIYSRLREFPFACTS
jgi:2'-5' RNA ligase